jgi:hypothetical protein
LQTGESLLLNMPHILQFTSICLILEWFRPGMVPNVVDYSCSKMKWSVKLKTKTSFTLFVCVCVSYQLGVDMSAMQILLYQFSLASFIIFLNVDNFQKKF